MRIDYAELLEFFFWGIEVFSRRDCGLILSGLRAFPGECGRNYLLENWRRQRLIERQGYGRQAQFRISEIGQQRLARTDPRLNWDRPWDGKWRAVLYDVPETRSLDRRRLWQALHKRKLGLLQRSVWVWPHDISRILSEVIETEGIPGHFCGFEVDRLFLCTYREIVDSAWDFGKIGVQHRRYLDGFAACNTELKRAKDLANLARIVRMERQAYQHAYSCDPLLPTTLLPKHYLGLAVFERHQQFNDLLNRGVRELANRENVS